ncbi:hypothetical protein PIB30_101129 [Stylosanthes scabra]|uniref:Uncharacterized protein n=1 Tax=Stylosanthes scabra TaxID=79078 RepID=A0ABU6TYR4_9FABA|nr:hypothetical protein [Stylosanthes scabra]
MFFIRLYPNGVTNRREDGIWFQCQSPMVFQHPRVSTLRELQLVMLSNLGGRFREIKEPNRRPMWMLVCFLNDEHIRVIFECHRRLMTETIIEFLVVAVETGTSSVPQSSESPRSPIDVTPLCIAGPIGDGVEAE